MTFYLCQYCGKQNYLGDTTCIHCGNPLPQAVEIPELDEILDHEFADQRETLAQMVEYLSLMQKELASLKEEVQIYQAGFQTMRELMEEKGVWDSETFEARWEAHLFHLQACQEKRSMLTRWLPFCLEEYDKTKFPRFQSFLVRALFSLEKGDEREAWSWLRDAEKMDPTNASLQACLGEWLFAENKYDSALDHLQKGKKTSWTLLLVGLCYLQTQRWEEGHKHFQQMKREGLDHYLVDTALAFLSRQKGDTPRAIDYLEQALQKQSFPEGHQALGTLYYEVGKPGKALVHLEKALDLGMESHELYFLLGHCYLHRGWTKKAERTFQKAVNLSPRLEYYQSLWMVKDFKRLQREFQGLPHRDRSALERGEKCLMQGEVEASLPLYKDLHANYPENARILLGYALSLTELGKTKEAENLLRGWLESHSVQAHAVPLLTLYIRLLKTIGEGKTAQRYLETWLALSLPPFVKAWLKLELAEVMLEQSRELKKAESFIEEAVQELPEDLKHRAWDALGWLAYHRGEYEKALRLLREAVEIYPDKTYWIHLGMVCLKLGFHEQAREAFQMAEQNHNLHPPMEHSFLSFMKSFARSKAL